MASHKKYAHVGNMSMAIFFEIAGNLTDREKQGMKKKERGGGVLLSHAISHAVPSAQRSLTTVFEMGTGVTSSL